GEVVALENYSPKRIRPVKANCASRFDPSSAGRTGWTAAPARLHTDPDGRRERESTPQDRGPRREPRGVVDVHSASAGPGDQRGRGLLPPRVSRERLRPPRRMGAAADPRPP